MTKLSSKKILQDKNTNDPSSITSLTLTHKALSDVSCLSEFKNLEKLDLGFNNLTSLEDLKLCVNLKWLSVVQNKLQSLKGIEGLTKLTVFNAGKNKLKSMNEIKSLEGLRALILNDNEISSVCKLDQMKELNTLVLSRNPIRSLGESLIKLKSITKLSLSNCQLQTVDSSLKSCTELKELRLAHNEITTIPTEFAHLVKLQNLDMGNNSIINRSSLKVLSSLVNLKNLNLQGNPIAEKDKLSSKVKKLLPNLHIFNSRPIDRIDRKEVDVNANDFSVGADNVLKLRKETQMDNNDDDLVSNKAPDFDEAQKSKHKKQKKNELAEKPDVKLDGDLLDRERENKPRKKKKRDQMSEIDDPDTPFMDLFVSGAEEVPLETGDKKFEHRTGRAIDEMSGLVTSPAKKKKKNRSIDPAALQLSQADEVGLGGPSAWE